MRWLLLLVFTGCNAGLHPYDACRDDGLANADAGFPPLAAELLVADVDTGVGFYRDTLGFSLVSTTAAEKSCFAVLDLEGGSVLLSHVPGRVAGPENNIELRFIVTDVDALDARYREKGVPYVRAIADQDYGLRDFVIRDPYGFRLRFARPL